MQIYGDIHMVDFSKLKANSGKKSLEDLNKKLASISGNSEGKGTDERFWSPTVDKAGNGYAIIRFLPAPPDEDVPFVRMFDHGFDQLRPGQCGIIQTQLLVFRLLFAHQVTRLHTQHVEYLLQSGLVGWCLQVFGNVRLNAVLFQQLQGLT